MLERFFSSEYCHSIINRSYDDGRAFDFLLNYPENWKIGESVKKSWTVYWTEWEIVWDSKINR